MIIVVDLLCKIERVLYIVKPCNHTVSSARRVTSERDLLDLRCVWISGQDRARPVT